MKIPNMSCFLSTTYWVFLFHILHVKYGIKRPNSLSFFFIILASSRTSGVPDRRSDGTMSVGPCLRLVAGAGDTFHPFPGPAPSQPARGPAGGPGLIPGGQPATARPRVNNGTRYSGRELTPGHPATNRPREGGADCQVATRWLVESAPMRGDLSPAW